MKRKPKAGVTLLELLIALWVMAAAAMILSSTLGMAGRALARVGAVSHDVDAITARLMLRRWLEAMPLQARLSGNDTEMIFGTLIDELPLTAALVTEVRVTGSGGAVRASAAEAVVVAELAPDGVLLALRYFGSPVPGGLPEWRPDWPVNAERLPDLVQISYTDRGSVVPPLTVIPARLARQSEMSLSSP
jgi:prepilin-type N-terminal cleavage/methylation domain-containing protein